MDYAAGILAVWAIDRQFAIRGVVQVSAAANGRAFLLRTKPSAALPKGSDPQAERAPQLEWR